ncbi:MAG: hypothetical protein P0S95_08090 [Rhabdochlamydiaceae bacterium]|nr:hypothetical protein [Candidatus Amphrikana amoebophyrae]
MKKSLLALAALFCSASLVADDMVNEYVNSLKNLECENPKVVLIMTAAPGMGRTQLAKQLEADFGAIRISHSDIGELYEKNGKNAFRPYMGIAKEVHRFDGEVLKALSKREDFKNGFIAIDGAFGGMILNFFKMQTRREGIKVVTVKMSAPEEEVMARFERECAGSAKKEAMMKSALREYKRDAKGRHDFDFDSSESAFDDSYESLKTYLSEKFNMTAVDHECACDNCDTTEETTVEEVTVEVAAVEVAVEAAAEEVVAEVAAVEVAIEAAAEEVVAEVAAVEVTVEAAAEEVVAEVAAVEVAVEAAAEEVVAEAAAVEVAVEAAAEEVVAEVAVIEVAVESVAEEVAEEVAAEEVA